MMETSTSAEALSESGKGASRRSETDGKSFRSRNLNAFSASKRDGNAARYPGE